MNWREEIENSRSANYVTTEFKISDDEVPVGSQFKVCAQENKIDVLLGTNCGFYERNKLDKSR